MWWLFSRAVPEPARRCENDVINTSVQERETAGSVQDEWHTGSSEKETNSIKIWGESYVWTCGVSQDFKSQVER